jgi:hypothetical protein
VGLGVGGGCLMVYSRVTRGGLERLDGLGKMLEKSFIPVDGMEVWGDGM